MNTELPRLRTLYTSPQLNSSVKLGKRPGIPCRLVLLVLESLFWKSSLLELLLSRRISFDGNYLPTTGGSAANPWYCNWCDHVIGSHPDWVCVPGDFARKIGGKATSQVSISISHERHVESAWSSFVRCLSWVFAELAEGLLNTSWLWCPIQRRHALVFWKRMSFQLYDLIQVI